MVVVTCSPSHCQSNLHPATQFHSDNFKAQIHAHLQAHPLSSKSSLYPPLHLHRLTLGRIRRRRGRISGGNGVVVPVRAYMDDSNSVASFASKVIGSLPIIGLVARIFSDEGGIGGDTIDFAEFRRRVGKKCSITDSRALYEFQERRGRAGDPLYVLFCCWLAAVGAGLIKSEDILEGVARLRISNDIEFEEENFLAIMKDAKECLKSW